MSDFEQKYRNWHAKISYAKSGIRLGASGCAIAISGDPASAIVILGVGFLIAEILGVLEEIF